MRVQSDWNSPMLQVEMWTGAASLQNWPFLVVNIRRPNDQVTPLLGNCSREMQMCPCKAWLWAFTSWFTMVKCQKHYKRPSTGRRTKNGTSVHWNCCLAIKRSKPVMYSMMWMNLKTIMLRKWSRYKRLYTVWFHVHKILENIYSDILTKCRSVVAWDLEWKKGWSTNRLEETLGCFKCFMTWF